MPATVASTGSLSRTVRHVLADWISYRHNAYIHCRPASPLHLAVVRVIVHGVSKNRIPTINMTLLHQFTTLRPINDFSREKMRA